MLVICSPAQGPVATVWEAGQVVGQSATQRQDKVSTVVARVSLLIRVTQATCPITDSGRDFLRSTQHRFTPFRIWVPPSSNETIVGVCSTRWVRLSTQFCARFGGMWPWGWSRGPSLHGTCYLTPVDVKEMKVTLMTALNSIPMSWSPQRQLSMALH